MSASPKISSFTIIVSFLCLALVGVALVPLLPVKLSPSRTLPHNEIGENYQMLLPLAYRYPCGYLQAKSGKYVIRKNSESHSGNALIFHNKIEQILQGTLQRMDLPAQERKYWQRRVKYKYFKKKIKVYLKQLLLGLPIDYRKIRNYFKG